MAKLESIPLGKRSGKQGDVSGLALFYRERGNLDGIHLLFYDYDRGKLDHTNDVSWISRKQRRRTIKDVVMLLLREAIDFEEYGDVGSSSFGEFFQRCHILLTPTLSRFSLRLYNHLEMKHQDIVRVSSSRSLEVMDSYLRIDRIAHHDSPTTDRRSETVPTSAGAKNCQSTRMDRSRSRFGRRSHSRSFSVHLTQQQ